MKKFLIALTLTMALSGTAYGETIRATVNGLVCAFCATGIEKTFKRQVAVDTIKVDLANKLVTISTKPQQSLDDDTVTKWINNAGYSVTDITREK
jgi:cation transport ATPase